MGFKATDATALNAVAGIFDLELWSGVSDPRFPVVHMSIGAAASAAVAATGTAAELLANAIDAANRSDQGVTVWIEVTRPEMPSFVADALDRLAGYGAGIVVTHATPAGMLCSHPPGGQLPQQFLDRLIKASRAEMVWHPLSRQPVPGIC